MEMTKRCDEWTGFEETVAQTAATLVRHREQSRLDGRAAAMRPMATILEELNANHWLEHGGMTEAHFLRFLDNYLEFSTRFHNPGYMSHQVAVPDMPSALADLIHGFTNNPLAIFEMGPGAASIEFAVTNWMLRKVGWREQTLESSEGDHAGGVFTHGGSLANLTALLAARAAVAPEAWEHGTPSDLAVLAPPSSHYSLARAVSIMGLGSRALVKLEVDEREVIRADRLAAVIEQTRQAGRRIMCVVASACATGSGLYDPLEEIGAICRDRGIWFHVDGAHGASALISAKYCHLVAGIELADSTVWDAHKMLRTSGLCTAVLFRRAEPMLRAMKQQASYLFYGDAAQGVDLIERTIECTKSPMATKLFLNLAWRGESGMAAYIDRQYDLAMEVYALISERAGFSCPYKPQSNILCFRYGESDEEQVAIREFLLNQGLFHLSSAEISGKRYLRMSLMNPETDRSTVERLLDCIESERWRT